MFRKTIFWLHLTIGLTVGIIVLIMSVTGVLLTYQKQMQSWADLRGLNGAAPAAGAVPLPVAVIVGNAQRAQAGEPSAVRWRAGAGAPVEVMFGRAGSVFLNAYTGEVLGKGSARMRSFFRVVTDWHRYLGREGAAREPGRKIASAANLAFLFLVLGGLYLWLPRNWTRAAFRNVLLFRRGLHSKARDFNWHNVIGIWSWAPLVIIVFSGVVISYPLTGEVIDRVLGTETAGRRAPPTDPTASVSPVGLDVLVARAKQQDPDWRQITLNLVPAKTGNWTFSLDCGNGGQPQKRAQLVLTPGGAVARWQPFSAESRAYKTRRFLRFAHTGEVAGLPGQTVAGLATAGVVLLVYTGIALALRRFLAWRSRRQPRVPAAAQQRVRVG